MESTWIKNQKNRFLAMCHRIKEDKMHLFWYVLFLFGVALAFFFIVLIQNSFTIPLSGDYCLQQIPFYTNGYDDWWTFFRTGKFPQWDYSTFLGANNIGSNSFYYILNPFFFPILLCPREYIAQGLAFLMILKMVLAGVTFRLYLKSLGFEEKTARLFALVYAFCGWNVFYLWFNHFMEICVVFPLVLMGIDKLIRTKRPWFLMASLLLMGLCNYFFLVSTCFCGVLYAIYRYFSVWKEKSNRDRLLIILIGFGAFFVGIMLASITLLPSLAVITSSSRVEDASYLNKLQEAFAAKDWKLLWQHLTKFESEKQAYYPLMSFLFPTISDFNSVLFPNKGYDNTLCSLFVYTPIMMFFVPSLLQSIRKKRFRHLIALGFFLFALFTPFFYYLCYGFTLAYGRWQIFAIAACLVFVARSYEERKEMPRWFFDISIGVLLIGVIIVVSYAKSVEGKQYMYELGDRIYVVIGEVIYMLVCYGVLRFHHRRRDLTRYLMGAIAIEAVVMGTLTFNYQVPNDYSTLYGGLKNVREEESIIRAIQKEDPGFYRIFNSNADRGANNLAMREGYKGISAFHSIYNYELNDFIKWSRISYSYNNWSMGVHEKRYNLDAFLNVKYYIQKLTGIVYQDNYPLGYEEVESLSTTTHKVYKNNQFVELGFAFDTITSIDGNLNTGSDGLYQLVSYGRPADYNEIAYLSTALLYPEDMEKVQTLLPNIHVNQYSEFAQYAASLHRFNPKQVTLQYDEEEKKYQQYVEEIKKENPNLSDVEIQEKIKTDYHLDITSYLPKTYTYTDSSYIRGYTWGSTLTIDISNYPMVCSDQKGCYLSLLLPMGQNAVVTMYDDATSEADNHIVVSDAHMYHYYNTGSDWKEYRGFYLRRDIKKIKVTLYYADNSVLIPYPHFYVEGYSAYQERMDKLKHNAFSDVRVTDNTIQFKTDYSEAKMIVLSVPYDKGWKGYYQGEDGEKEIPIFKAQGGFLAFPSLEGETQYVLKYETPNLKQAIIICCTGLLIFGSTWAAVYVVERKKEKELAKSEKIEENPLA